MNRRQDVVANGFDSRQTATEPDAIEAQDDGDMFLIAARQRAQLERDRAAAAPGEQPDRRTERRRAPAR